MLANLPPYKLSQLKVVVLTGASISAEYGLKTFRDNNGCGKTTVLKTWHTPEGFGRNAESVCRHIIKRH
jgi:NAD-dependent deacetylase